MQGDKSVLMTARGEIGKGLLWNTWGSSIRQHLQPTWEGQPQGVVG